MNYYKKREGKKNHLKNNVNKLAATVGSKSAILTASR